MNGCTWSDENQVSEEQWRFLAGCWLAYANRMQAIVKAAIGATSF